MAGFMDKLRGVLEGVRQDAYPKARNYLARQADLLGGAQSDASAKDILHGQGNYNLTKKLGSVFPPDIAANLSDAAYLGNETFTGALAKLTGRPFFSDYGFRWKDVAINRGGQDRALRELRGRSAARRARLEAEGVGMRRSLPEES